MAIDSTTVANNNASIVTAAATIAAAFIANKVQFAAGVTAAAAANPNSLALAGRLASDYPAEVARTLAAAGLTDVLAAAHDARIHTENDFTIHGAGTTGLAAVWTARIAAGQLGPHT